MTWELPLVTGDEMSIKSRRSDLVEISTDRPIWDHFFYVAPLVLIGTTDADGEPDLAPKHMVTPMGWQNYFGFVCAPTHGTCSNIERTGEFTVSYPKPSQLLYTSLAATPREADGHKHVLESFDTFSGGEVDAPLIQDAHLYFECRHFKTVTGFGTNCLITGEIVAAYAEQAFLRASEHDDQELIHESPLFAYLSPGRFATIDRSNGFPFPMAMRK